MTKLCWLCKMALSENLSITLISQLLFFSRLFITGDVRGHVKFYDRKFRILYWIANFPLPKIIEVGFHRYGRNVSYADIQPPVVPLASGLYKYTACLIYQENK